MMRALRCLKCALTLALLVLATGCTHVAPWERGRLAQYGMRADRDPLQDAGMEHVYFSREAAVGGRSIGGGGCGCN